METVKPDVEKEEEVKVEKIKKEKKEAKPVKEKVFVGYHPVTGAEIFE